MIAKVAVCDIVYHLDKLYSYHIPSTIEPTLKKGMRVLIPYGRGNSKREGVVFSFDEPDAEAKFLLKPITLVLDQNPLLDDNALALASFIKERTFCTYYDAAKLLLPPGSGFKSEQCISINHEKAPAKECPPCGSGR